MLVGARGMGVGDERKLHHGGQAQAEDEEQHNDAAGLPAAISPATAAYFVGPHSQTHKRELPLKALSTAARAFSVATSPPRKFGLTTIWSAVGYNMNMAPLESTQSSWAHRFPAWVPTRARAWVRRCRSSSSQPRIRLGTASRRA